jgi:hypothetical protein
VQFRETSAWQVRETLDKRFDVNSEAGPMWKRPAPEWWGQGRSAVPKRQLHYFSVAGRGILKIQAARCRVDLPRD